MTARNVLVTGAAHGIGRAIARRFSEEGDRLILVDRDADALAELGDALPGSLVLAADVADAGAVAEVVDRAAQAYGSIDVAVNNAGRGGDGPLLDLDPERWSAIIAVNLTGPFLISRAVARLMARTSTAGSIVTIASVAGIMSERESPAYCASKAGVLGLVRSMAIDLAPYGIRANAISPGYTDTERLRSRVGQRLHEHMRDAFDRVPARRLVAAEEVADACAYLASDRASGITGQNLVVDCGLSANLFVVETLPEAWPDG